MRIIGQHRTAATPAVVIPENGVLPMRETWYGTNATTTMTAAGHQAGSHAANAIKTAMPTTATAANGCDSSRKGRAPDTRAAATTPPPTRPRSRDASYVTAERSGLGCRTGCCLLA